jgi:hypothetical protein
MDLDPAAGSKLGSIGTHGCVETGNNVMIGGFIIGGDGAAIAPSWCEGADRR